MLSKISWFWKTTAVIFVLFLIPIWNNFLAEKHCSSIEEREYNGSFVETYLTSSSSLGSLQIRDNNQVVLWVTEKEIQMADWTGKTNSTEYLLNYRDYCFATNAKIENPSQEIINDICLRNWLTANTIRPQAIESVRNYIHYQQMTQSIRNKFNQCLYNYDLTVKFGLPNIHNIHIMNILLLIVICISIEAIIYFKRK